MKRILIGLVLLLALGLVAGFVSMNSIVVAAIEKAGTTALGVETEVDDADVGLISSDARLDGLTVANPEGFGEAPFLSLGHGAFDLNARSLFDEVIRIPTVTLDGTHLRVAQRGTESNVATILANLERGGGGEPDVPDADGGKRFLIDRIVLRDVTVDVAVDLLGNGMNVNAATLEIPEVVVEDLGTSEEGAPLYVVIGQVVEALLSATLRADGSEILDGTLRNTIQQGLGDLGQRGREALEDAIDRAGDELEGVLDDAKKGIGGKAGEILKGVGDGRSDGQGGNDGDGGGGD